MQSKILCSRLEVHGVWFLQHKQRGWGGCPCGTQTCHFQPGIYCYKKRYSISPLIHTIWGGSRSLNKFSSSAESEMYREQYGEYAYQRVKANFRSKCYFCVFRYCLFLIRYCIKCHFVFLYNSQQTFIFWRLLVILAAKRRNVQYIGYKYVTSIGRGCSFLMCALIGSLR